MALDAVTTNKLRIKLPSTTSWRGEKRLSQKSSGTIEAAPRFDLAVLGETARDLAKGTAIKDVAWRRRPGGAVDIYFIVDDREAGYAAAAPIIRELLNASALSLDFHVAEPGEIRPER